jgi:hypothetical protein
MRSLRHPVVRILLITTTLSAARIIQAAGPTTLTLGIPMTVESKSPRSPLRAAFEFDGKDGSFRVCHEGGDELGSMPLPGMEWLESVRPDLSPTVEITWSGDGRTAFLLVKGLLLRAIPPEPICEGDGLLDSECDANWIWFGFEGTPRRPLQVLQ